MWGEREELRCLASVIGRVLFLVQSMIGRNVRFSHLYWKTVTVPIKIKVAISSVNEFSWLFSSAMESSPFS